MSASTGNSFWNWITGEWAALEHFLKNLVASEVAAIAPLAEQALAEIGINIVGATTPTQIAKIAGQVLTATAPKIEAAGLQVAASSILAGVGNAISKAQAAAAALPAPVPATPVVPTPVPTVPAPVASTPPAA